jgi:L-amino acid N-acyltransferase YncA
MGKRIRSVDVSDAPAVQEIYAPFVSDSATSFEVVAPDLAEVERRIRTHGDRHPWLVFERDRTVLGYAYASTHRARQAYQWCVEVSVYVHAEVHHCGVGRALYTALFELLRRQGYVNAYAGITLPNPASIGLHESLGFVPVGVFSRIGFKFDRWHDVAWLYLRLLEDPRPLRDPLSAMGVLQQESMAVMLETCAQSIRGI